MIIDYLSASRAELYISCPFKYFLKYHLDLDELNLPSIATEKGSAVHAALEEHLKGNSWQDTLQKFYARTKLWQLDNRKLGKGFPHPVQKDCDNCKWAKPSIDGAFCSIADRLVSTFDGCPKPNFEDDVKLMHSAIKHNEDVFSRKIIGTEVPFEFSIGALKVKGFMDLVSEISPEILEVRDYKSGNYAKDTEEMAKDIQMRLYSVAAKKLFPSYKYVMMTLDYLRKSPVSMMFSSEDDDKTIAVLTEIQDKIEKSVDPPRIKSFKCNWCVGYEKCGEIRKSFLDANGNFTLPPPANKKTRGRTLPTIEGK